ncbi:MAG: hypothetical protein JO047_04970 [Alphaproteobacteria bacterium]|nr:hypothetical protein [Alphaproteobacteria bacterium]
MPGRAAGALLGTALLLAACAGPPPPEPVYVPPSYSYLNPLRLDVGTVEIADDWTPGPEDAGVLAPVRPLDALHRMAADRLGAGGSAGRAVLRIQDAAIRRTGERLDGNFAVRLEVVGADGALRGFAVARVTRTATLPDDDALRPTLYAMINDMMRDMNVELEYQVRRTLARFLVGASPAGAAVPAPVQQQPLPPPGAAPPGAPPPSGI